jgi:hypothetical protein
MSSPAGSLLRANPRYELVPFDRLAAAEREALAGRGSPAELYGLLRPRPGESLGEKWVDCDTALLFLTLREPGPLPGYVKARLGDAASAAVAGLVGGGVLEVVVETAADAADAADAAHAYETAEGFASGAAGRLASLSASALRYAGRLAVDDPLLLADRLYFYNRRPLTPAWVRRLPDSGSVRDFLGIGPDGAHRGLLERNWSEGSSRSRRQGWLNWRSHFLHERPAGSSGATWKLYASPRPEALPECFGALLEAFAAARVPRFKVGDGALGLLRPDKIVAHFGSFEELSESAERLAARLDGIPAQGVPFTGEIGCDGLLSWGVDPPAAERTTAARGTESWRFWLTRRLARAILDARALGDPEPWAAATRRLRLDGVDTDSWTPEARLWRWG